eukprot:scaffold19935_cov108-Isochrysis_galbana.AAC.9
MSFHPLAPEDKLRVWPHGLIGQSFDGDDKPPCGQQGRVIVGGSCVDGRHGGGGHRRHPHGLPRVLAEER